MDKITRHTANFPNSTNATGTILDIARLGLTMLPRLRTTLMDPNSHNLSLPANLTVHGNMSLPINGTATWDRTQPITWNPTSAGASRIAGVRVNNTTTGGIEIATSNATASGPIYCSQFSNTNWTSGQRCLTLLDEQGNTIIPGNLTVNSLIRGDIYDFIFPLRSFKMLYYHPGGGVILPGNRVDDVMFINQMRTNLNQTWVTVAKNASWGTLRMDIVQRNG